MCMRGSWRQVIFLGAFLGFSALARAEPPPPAIAARSWLIYDRTAAQILGAGNPDLRWEPASLTKLMTAYLVYEAVRDGRLAWDQAVTVPDAVRRVGNEETRMYLRPGSRVPVETLLRGLLIISANDAALTLAQAVEGGEEAFVARMNATAARLGMAGTHFNNPSGIPGPTHYTTAHDLLRLTLAFDRDFPQIYDITRERRFSFRQFEKAASNPLLAQDTSVDGLKTGHTDAAGYNMVTSVRRPASSPEDRGRGFVAIVLGTPSKAARAQTSRDLIDYAATAFQPVDVLTAGKDLHRARILGAVEEAIPLGVEQTRTLLLPADTRVALRFTLDEAVRFAPVPRGTVMGRVEVLGGGEVLAEAPLVTLQEPVPAPWPSRFYDWMALLFSRAVG